jgi:hypothetical protein
VGVPRAALQSLIHSGLGPGKCCPRVARLSEPALSVALISPLIFMAFHTNPCSPETEQRSLRGRSA